MKKLEKLISEEIVYSLISSIGLGALLLIFITLSEPKKFEVVQASHIDYSKYIEKQNIEEEVFGVSYPVATYNDWVPEMTEMEMTYYTDYGTCADGITKAHEGVCAVKKELIGMTAIVYSLDDELIGIFECCDTGYGREEENGKGTIQNGNCIDIYRDNDMEGRELIKAHGNRVKVQFINAEG